MWAGIYLVLVEMFDEVQMLLESLVSMILLYFGLVADRCLVSPNDHTKSDMYFVDLNSPKAQNWSGLCYLFVDLHFLIVQN